MKNISFFPSLVIIILIISVNYSAFCQNQPGEKANTLSLGASFGVVFGQATELVYATNETKGKLLSELLWDMKPLVYFQFQADYGRTDPMSSLGLFTSLSFKFGIPGDSGIIENRDWMSTENSNLTHFSSHTNRTNEFYWLDAVIGVSIPVKSYFYLKPFLSGSWMHFSFTGRDGSATYARNKDLSTYYPINDNPEKISFIGKEVIQYQQDWLLLALGTSIGTNIFFPWSFELSFQISPFTYCAAVDNHIGRNTIFNDYTAWGLFIEPKGSVSYSIGRFDILFEAAYRYIGRTRGYTDLYKDNRLYSAGNESGAGLGIFDARIFVKFKT